MAHTFSTLLYHVVFGTKDREPSIDGELRSDLHAYLRACAAEICHRQHWWPRLCQPTLPAVPALSPLRG